MATLAISTTTPTPNPRHFPFRSISISISNSVSISTFTIPKPPEITLSRTAAFVVSAVGRRTKGRNNTSAVESEIHAGDEEEEWESEAEEEEEDLTAFDQMRNWMRNRPAGFGEGKTYDVSLEEKLLEEIERSKKVTSASVDNVKGQGSAGGSVVPKKKQPPQPRQQPNRVIDVARIGIRVRIGNLPKKRNILRDLQPVFKAFPGIININPATIGTKKTRDPVCRGFAFIDFVSEEAANRFVKAYSKHNLTFGKVEKQITCHIMPAGSSNSDSEPLHSESALNERSNVSSSLKYQEKSSESSDVKQVNKSEVLPVTYNALQVSPQVAHTETSIESSDIYSTNFRETADHPNEVDLAPENSLISADMQKKRGATLKKNKKKTKPQTSPTSNLSGSAKRLKFKERNVMINVFSKYNGESAALVK